VRQPGDPVEVAPVVWRAPSGAAAAPGIPALPAETATLRAQMAELEQQCEQRVREARAAGAREGETAGRSRAQAEMQAALDRLARSIDDVASLRARLRAEAEADLVKLALAIARRILRREIALDPDALHGLILGALAKLQGQEIARVRVHPSHAAALTACLRQNLNAGNVEIVPDPSRDVGGVIFETPRGNLDAGVESQLAEIERGLADRLRRIS
jgi:flagellar assembly protein FliH